MKISKRSLGDIWDYNKISNIHIFVVPSGEEQKSEAKNVLKEIMAESFLNMKKVSQEVVQTPNPKKFTLTLLWSNL